MLLVLSIFWDLVQCPGVSFWHGSKGVLDSRLQSCVLQVSGEEHEHDNEQKHDTERGQHTVEDLMLQLKAL